MVSQLFVAIFFWFYFKKKKKIVSFFFIKKFGNRCALGAPRTLYNCCTEMSCAKPVQPPIRVYNAIQL